MKPIEINLPELADSLSKRCRHMTIELDVSAEQEFTIRLTGALDTENSNILQAGIRTIKQSLVKEDSLVIDLHGVQYIASMGIGVLTMTMIELNREGISLTLRNLQPATREIFRTLGILAFFHVEDLEKSE